MTAAIILDLWSESDGRSTTAHASLTAGAAVIERSASTEAAVLTALRRAATTHRGFAGHQRAVARTIAHYTSIGHSGPARAGATQKGR